MRVVEIFKSIDGEGIRTGLPVTFVRLAGCNLRCSFCDTKYSYDDAESIDMTIDEIMESCRTFGTSRVTVTGGEPLIHSGIADLLLALSKEFEVNVETNGSILPPVSFHKSIVYTMDYKCTSSGMKDKMNMRAIKSLRETDVLKFVVGSEQDMQDALEVIKMLQTLKLKTNIFFSPVFGKIEPVDIVKFILANDLYDCRVQLQLHKLIWDPAKRGV